jgi:phosphate transport system substrate-binding protein
MSITAFRPILLFASALLTCCASGTLAHADEIRIGGTGSATELLRQLAEGFAKEGRVDVIPSLGSSGAIRAVSDGALDLAVSGRPLKPEEQKRGLVVDLVARTPFVIATSHPNPNGLKTSSLMEAFSSMSGIWNDGQPIRIILRPRSESDTTLMGELFPGLASAIEGARKRPEVPIAATDQDNVEAAEKMPGSLVGSTLTQITLEKRNLRMVAIDGVAPTLENFERGSYPYAKRLYFVLPTTPSPAAKRFLEFLRSAEGLKLLREAAVIL